MTESGCTSDYADLVGDGYCDDTNNNEECHWDEGDCCGENVDTSHCNDCNCLDPLGITKAS